eukprot:jgi/Pico_ML_1/51761/g321.t1
MTFGQQNNEAEAHAQLTYAWERGVNFIDTAEIYPVMPMRDTQGRTSEYVGSTIVGATSVEQLKENLESFVDLDEDILKAIDEVHIQFRNPSLVD